jgi:hypothetical protein
MTTTASSRSEGKGAVEGETQQLILYSRLYTDHTHTKAVTRGGHTGGRPNTGACFARRTFGFRTQTTSGERHVGRWAIQQHAGGGGSGNLELQ